MEPSFNMHQNFFFIFLWMEIIWKLRKNCQFVPCTLFEKLSTRLSIIYFRNVISMLKRFFQSFTFQFFLSLTLRKVFFLSINLKLFFQYLNIFKTIFLKELAWKSFTFEMLFLIIYLRNVSFSIIYLRSALSIINVRNVLFIMFLRKCYEINLL